MREIPNLSSTQQFKAARVIGGLIRAEVFDRQEAERDPELLNLPCGHGAQSREELQVVQEVRGAFNSTWAGQAGDVKVIKLREYGGGLIGASLISMAGDHDCPRHLFNEPYIAAIARHDDYYRYVLRGPSSTSAGGIVLRATVEVIVQESPTSFIYARVRIGNASSHRIFTEAGFERLPRHAFRPPTEQVIRRRPPTASDPPPLPLHIYLPPRRLILPPGCKADYPLD